MPQCHAVWNEQGLRDGDDVTWGGGAELRKAPPPPSPTSPHPTPACCHPSFGSRKLWETMHHPVYKALKLFLKKEGIVMFVQYLKCLLKRKLKLFCLLLSECQKCLIWWKDSKLLLLVWCPILFISKTTWLTDCITNNKNSNAFLKLATTPLPSSCV